MAKERANIIAMRNGSPAGYIKSISYTKKTFKLTQNKSEAKGYTTSDKIQYDIDFLTAIAYSQGFVFVYN